MCQVGKTVPLQCLAPQASNVLAGAGCRIYGDNF